MGLRQKIILMAGPPGSGKTTHSLQLAKKYNFKHISAGDCLREEMANPDSADSQIIRDLISVGTIVPVAITVRLLIKKFKSLGWGQHVVVLDGFPRNQDNLYGWLKYVTDDTDVVHAICLMCTDETSYARIHHRTNQKAQDRDDNNECTIKRRIDVFKYDTLPIMEALRLGGKCSLIDANGSKEQVWEDICKCVDALNLT